ncbi:unnamed protein product [Ixodes persulcatus]
MSDVGIKIGTYVIKIESKPAKLRNPSYDGSTSFCHRLETSVGDNALWQGSQSGQFLFKTNIK